MAACRASPQGTSCCWGTVGGTAHCQSELAPPPVSPRNPSTSVHHGRRGSRLRGLISYRKSGDEREQGAVRRGPVQVRAPQAEEGLLLRISSPGPSADQARHTSTTGFVHVCETRELVRTGFQDTSAPITLNNTGLSRLGFQRDKPGFLCGAHGSGPCRQPKEKALGL